MDQIDRIIQREGGNRVVNLRGDTGGVTKYGISSKNHPDLDIPNLTYQEARTIYETEYLKSPKIDLVPQPLQEQLLDFAVHSRPNTAIRKLQMLLNVEEDGVIGPQTINKLNTFNIKDIHNALVKVRILFLLNIEKPQFWRGWVRRAVSFIL